MTRRPPLVALATAALLFCMADANAASRAADLTDPLVSVDRNRANLIADMVKSSGLEGDAAEKLGNRLAKLRADRLLAASLATSRTSLEAVLKDAESTSATPVAAQSKVLGDARADLLYTPLTPCRLIDTRGFGAPFVGGPYQPGERRSYTPNAACLIPFTKVVSLMVGVTTENLTPNSGGVISVLSPTAPVSTTTDVFNLGASWSATNTVVNTGDGGQFDVVVIAATANVVIDVLGYFGPPTGPSAGSGTVTSVTGGAGLTGGTITGAGTLAIAAPYQLPQACTNGQTPVSNGAGGWTCGTPSGGGATPASTVASETAFNQAAAVGTSALYARADHTHGTPALPAMGGDVSGSLGAVTVAKLRGVDVAAAAPASGQVLTYNGAQAAWAAPAASAAVVAFGGAAGNIPGASGAYVFVGAPAPINVSGPATKVTGAATAVLYTTAGLAPVIYGICYQLGGGALSNPMGANAPTANVTAIPTPLTATFSFSGIGAGAYNVGFCTLNSGVTIDGGNKSVNGWLVVN